MSSINAKVLHVLMIALLVTACDGNPSIFQYGRAIPDARFSVRFDRPLSDDVLEERVRLFAELSGYPFVNGGPSNGTTLAERQQSPGVWTLRLYNKPSDTLKEKNITVIATFSAQDEWLEIVFHQAGVSLFDVEDWEEFFKLYREVAPEVFPEATFEISRHPAEMTNKNNVEEIARQLGEELPADIVEKLRKL